MAENIIEIRGVSKNFGSTSVLNNINLDIARGEFMTLLGPSGCGKTTLLRIISGFETPDEGKIFIAGNDMATVPANQRHVNTVFQRYALFPHMSVFDNVAFGLRCRKVVEDDIQTKVTLMLDKVDLSGFEARMPDSLSGGQQQRVAIARALVNQPYVLLLDEPMSALDYRLRKNMQIELKALQRELGLTFICVTHDQEEALSMSDRIAVMSQGEIKQMGTPRDVYEKPGNITVAKFIGETNFLTTQIISATPEQLHVAIEGNILYLKNPLAITKDQPVVTLVRPEDLKVWRTEEIDETKNMYHGIVETIVYKGSTVDLIVKLDSGTHLLATEFFDEDDETLVYTQGEAVWVEWYPGWEVVLPQELS